MTATPKNGHPTSDTALPRLTPRERTVLLLICEGFSSQEVADRLSISKRTVSFNLATIYRKLGVQNRLQAVVQARQSGLIDALTAEAAVPDNPPESVRPHSSGQISR